MHAGHVDFLRQARELGDFLIVGVWGDPDVNDRMGGNYPIMNINERFVPFGVWCLGFFFFFFFFLCVCVCV